MSYRLGVRSECALVGVRAPIVAVVRKAILLTQIDFAVHEGVRTLERQKKLVDGQLRWEHALCNEVARAMFEASGSLGVPLVWGRVWDTALIELDPDDFEGERALYVQRYQRIQGPKKFPLDDGPHFQGERL